MFEAVFLLLLPILILVVSIYFILSNTKEPFHHPCSTEIFSFVTKHGGHFLAHLMFLNDKYGFWSNDKTVYFSLQRMAGRVIVLGDPIGDELFYRSALEELQGKYRANYVKEPIFYQISSKYKSMYEELNYQIIKIGEEAKVSLSNYSLEGKQGAKLRAPRNKFERNGYLLGKPNLNILKKAG